MSVLQPPLTRAFAARATRRASLQSYLTIRLLADRRYRDDAFALYAYFRWLDDEVDERLRGPAERLALVARERRILAGRAADDDPLGPAERLLADLLRTPAGTPRPDAGGSRRSVAAMLDVMEFDAGRRGRPLTCGELEGYTRNLAVAVTEALHHCIGHDQWSPRDETRYVAVAGAHVVHMLRDLTEDRDAGYLNLPADAGPSGDPGAFDPDDPAVRAWVRERVRLARACFAVGRGYLARVECARCRLAGHAYIARFEWVLDAVERDGYRLRDAYPERATWRGGLAVAAAAIRSAHAARRGGPDRAEPAGRARSSR